MFNTIGRCRRASRPAFVAALGALAFAALPGTASAYDNKPCTEQRNNGARNFDGWTVTLYFCPLWHGDVPVHQTTDPRSRVVGYLDYGGKVNWFLYGVKGARQTYAGGSNVWWASTKADNGRWGWVNQVHFAGGGDDEPDAGLFEPGAVACVLPCNRPMPVWRKPPPMQTANHPS